MKKDEIDQEQLKKTMDSLYPQAARPDESQWRYWKGDVRRSEWDLYKTDMASEKVKRNLDAASMADSLPDAVDALLSSRSPQGTDPVHEYIEKRLPHTDTWEECRIQETKELVEEEVRETHNTLPEVEERKDLLVEETEVEDPIDIKMEEVKVEEPSEQEEVSDTKTEGVVKVETTDSAVEDKADHGTEENTDTGTDDSDDDGDSFGI